jgi:hypothetical protein
MTNDENSPRILIAAVLHDLEEEAEAVLDLAKALEDQATGTGSGAAPQRLRQMGALVKSAALALLMAAANVVGATDRLTLVAALAEVDDSGPGELPS